jgi:N-acetylglucosaminylphosphatidylinositol deacetylase
MTSGFPTLVGKRICLLIAHPDDEAMFFSPTLLSLSRPELQNRIFILCLSSGDADGLGHIRKTELAKSALLLGIPSAEQVVVVDDERFPDSMTQHWEAKEVAKVLQHYFAPKMKTMSADAAPTAMIDALITFDESGVSSHPNHISLYHGASTFLRNLMQRHSGWESPVKMYTLTSTNVVRKYGSVVDAMVTVLVSLVRKKRSGDFPTPMLAVSGVGGLSEGEGSVDLIALTVVTQLTVYCVLLYTPFCNAQCLCISTKCNLEHRISFEVHISQIRRNANQGIRQVHLNHTPHPQSTQRRRLLHHRIVIVHITHMDSVAARANTHHEEEKLSRHLDLPRSLRPHHVDHQPQNRQHQSSALPNRPPLDLLSVLLERQHVQREVEHGQADGPEDRFAYWPDGFAVAESGFEDIAAFVANESVIVVFGEGSTLFEEVFPLFD